MEVFKSNGKILLTAEYIVLEGAKSLALPTKKGQSLIVDKGAAGKISWESLDENQNCWFQAEFKINKGTFDLVQLDTASNDTEFKNTAKRLQQILALAFKMNSEKLQENRGYKIRTQQDFNRKWGLGTSSTLINNIAQWLEVDPFKLLEGTFGGSGYDIAAAMNNHPITFQLTSGAPAVFSAPFDPSFKDELFFVYLNKKQNSREAIAHFKNQPETNLLSLSEKISGITEQIILSNELEQFKMLMEAHETLISQAVNLPKVKISMFPDFSGLVKSLGGWGGDFVLATGKEEEKQYFREKGYTTIFNYDELIK